ncbi:hypothetical protein NIASO_09460 [Niabella soli DSM 19437]|uniref:Uncharacterized protein n=1 Tax=Niabella soli DSM 19437 TaxID=929713 RepID=W0F7V4_9BACT|nr:hypothetical protein NIASO_09460 [Niabella soli DSM 19437]
MIIYSAAQVSNTRKLSRITAAGSKKWGRAEKVRIIFESSGTNVTFAVLKLKH